MSFTLYQGTANRAHKTVISELRQTIEHDLRLDDASHWQKVRTRKGDGYYCEVDHPHGDYSADDPKTNILDLLKLVYPENEAHTDIQYAYKTADGEITPAEYHAMGDRAEKASPECQQPLFEEILRARECVLVTGSTAKQVMEMLGVDIHRIKEAPQRKR